MTLEVRDNQAILRKVNAVTEGTYNVSFLVRFKGENDTFCLRARTTEEGELRFYCGTGVLNSGRTMTNEEYRHLLDLALASYRESPAVIHAVQEMMYVGGISPVYETPQGVCKTLKQLSTPQLLQALTGYVKSKTPYEGEVGTAKLRAMYFEAGKRGIKMTKSLNDILERHGLLKGGVN